MRAIYKYELDIEDEQSFNLPEDSVILSVANQREKPVLYALVDPNKPTYVRYTIYTRGTGHPADDMENMAFIDTVLFREGQLVFHYFYDFIEIK